MLKGGCRRCGRLPADSGHCAGNRSPCKPASRPPVLTRRTPRKPERLLAPVAARRWPSMQSSIGMLST